MTWLVLTIIFAAITVIALVIGIAGLSLSRSDPHDSDAGLMKGWGFGIAGTMMLFEIIVTIWTSMTIIEAGHIGVVYGFGGGDIVGRLENGTRFIAPWREVKEVSAQVQRAEFNFLGDNSAVSLEAQPVYARVRVNYQLEPSKIVELYRNVGANWFHILMEGRAAQDFKQITARYRTVEITPNRERIRQETIDAMREELAPYSIHVVDVQLANIGFPQAFTDAIERKQVATQDALAAQQKVAQSKAEADQKVEAAKGEAESTLVKARAQATANGLLSRSLTPNIIQYEWVQKIAPTVTTQLVPPNAIFSLPGGASKASK